MTQSVSKASEILTVSQLTQQVKQHLESRFSFVAVQGEVSNFRAQSSGHLYFSLKDSAAQLSAVMFRGSASHLKQMPKDGDQVLIRGELNVYPPRGQYQVICRELYFVGLGELLIRLEQLKTKLAGQGYFAEERKRPLPASPKRIGVVTSPTGAAIQDIVNILSRRYAGFQLLLNPVRVQGAEAAGEIARAIRAFNQYRLVDVMIVGRGGGSLEDLWAFNEEVVANAIFHSEIPVISAVGHERDITLSDLVADLRAPTPSAAAELVASERAHQLRTLRHTTRRLEHTIKHLLTSARHQLKRFQSHPLLATPYGLLARPLQQLDDLRTHLDAAVRQTFARQRLHLLALKKQFVALRPQSRIIHFRQLLSQLQSRLDHSAQRMVKQRQERLLSLCDHLAAVDPKRLLAQGYSILFAEKDGAVVSSTRQMCAGERVRAQVSDGESLLEVIK